MISFPNAKINIGLNITAKRSDGFHHLQSVFYPIALADAMEVMENPSPNSVEFSATYSGVVIPESPSGNICKRAYELIKKEYALPNVRFHLHKHIPIGAGLGGGSADAAFFIRLLNKAFELHLSFGEMHHYARQLGSDCSFFINNKPAYIEGRGDEMEAALLDLSSYYIVLVYPNVHISTSMAYAGVTPTLPHRNLEDDVLNLPISEWQGKVKNDFEDSLFPKHPILAKIKQQLYDLGACYASMSGSGSALYGLFSAPPELDDLFQGCFVWQHKML